MARFYGALQGARGPASRLGNGVSGLKVTAQTWGESFVVYLWAQDTDVGKKTEVKRDFGSVHLGGFCLFHGDTDMLKTEQGVVTWFADLISHNDKKLVQPVLIELAKRGLAKLGG